MEGDSHRWHPLQVLWRFMTPPASLKLQERKDHACFIRHHVTSIQHLETHGKCEKKAWGEKRERENRTTGGRGSSSPHANLLLSQAHTREPNICQPFSAASFLTSSPRSTGTPCWTLTTSLLLHRPRSHGMVSQRSFSIRSGSLLQ